MTERQVLDEDEQAFEVRFGHLIVDYGITTIPTVFLDNYAKLGLSHGEALTVIHCWRYKWDARHPYPSVKTLAEKMGVSRRQVRYYLASLKKKGFLVVIDRRPQTNLFIFNGLLNASVENSVKPHQERTFESETDFLFNRKSVSGKEEEYKKKNFLKGGMSKMSYPGGDVKKKRDLYEEIGELGKLFYKVRGRNVNYRFLRELLQSGVSTQELCKQIEHSRQVLFEDEDQVEDWLINRCRKGGG